MKILVTGCHGFIGTHTVGLLLKEGHKVIGFDNMMNPSLDYEERIRSMAGRHIDLYRFEHQDIRNFSNMLRRNLKTHVPNCIVHLAAVGSVPRSFEEPGLYADINERGFANVLSLASEIGCPRIVFASSSSVYGSCPENPKREEYTGQPLSPYALSKQTNEKLAHMWRLRKGLDYIGLRFFNVYGPGQRFDSQYSAVIPKFIKGPIEVYGGAQTRDFTFVGDVAQTILKAIESEESGHCLNVGTGRSVSIEYLAQSLSRGLPITYKDPRSGEARHSTASVENLQRILKYKPNTTLSEGLKLTEEFYHKWLTQTRQNLDNSSQELRPTQTEVQP